jgi:hypothetical protein
LMRPVRAFADASSGSHERDADPAGRWVYKFSDCGVGGVPLINGP